ncbi:hypothetical protein SAMN05444000_111105 [Shimia gijangensis]|uniref:NAD glycohydrolase translocation F5/8 type C domain-containing protein n=1 Tax=Shimia gijangensis TaxID=1470563 RepID=A0A1M6L7E2_9RHOB|nr:hypothetical protein [Shimia gijangensis]SHJ67102.1 hypothetical protein SAMN05444000_111105 [Shimia gijangensis]
MVQVKAALFCLMTATPVLAAGSECVTTNATQAFNRETVCTSSHLAPQAGNRYNTHSMSDDDMRTAWCEGVSGNGIGEALAIEWDGAGPLQTLWISNGYAKNSGSFSNNGRIKDVTVALWRAGASDSDYTTFQYQLEDHGVEQPINMPFPQNELRRLVLRIDSVYPGAKWQDTCINEIWTDFGF